MIHDDSAERELVIHQALRARTEVEVEAAIETLDNWLQEHPDDQSIRDAYEPLLLRQTTFRPVTTPPLAAANKS